MKLTLKVYNELVSEKATVGQIHLSSFLTIGAKVLDGGYRQRGEMSILLKPIRSREITK